MTQSQKLLQFTAVESIFVTNITLTIITGVNEYRNWGAYYGICHALLMTSTKDAKYFYWKELREYFNDLM